MKVEITFTVEESVENWSQVRGILIYICAGLLIVGLVVIMVSTSMRPRKVRTKESEATYN